MTEQKKNDYEKLSPSAADVIIIIYIIVRVHGEFSLFKNHLYAYYDKI